VLPVPVPVPGVEEVPGPVEADHPTGALGSEPCLRPKPVGQVAFAPPGLDGQLVHSDVAAGAHQS